MPEGPDNALLKAKEELFLEYIKILCEALELKKLPKVIFCDGYTPMGPNAKACIDSASWTIWVSRIHLRMMSFEEIKKTAGHELNHLFIGPHNAEFRNKLNELLVATWEPEFTSGLKVIDGGKEVEKPEKQSEKEIDKTECNRHSCNITTGLECCSHCGGYYCKEHIKPLPPLLPNFNNPDEFMKWKYREKFHPCPPYYDFLAKKYEDQIKEMEEKFNKMRALKITRINVTTVSEPFQTVPPKSLINNESDTDSSKNDENKLKQEKSFGPQVVEKGKKTLKCEYCGKKIGLLAVRYTWLDKEKGLAIHDKCIEEYEKKKSEKTSETQQKQEQERNLKHTNVGIASIILGIFGFFTLINWLTFFKSVQMDIYEKSLYMTQYIYESQLDFTIRFWTGDLFAIWVFIPLFLGILAIFIGRNAKKQNDSYGKYGMILGILVIIFGLIQLTSTLYLFFTGFHTY